MSVSVMQVWIVSMAMLQTFVLVFVGMGYFTSIFSLRWFVSAGVLVAVMKIVHMLVFVLQFFVIVDVLMLLADVQVDPNSH